MEKVRFGIIGVGNQGSYYAKTLFKNNKIKDGYISAMCDTNSVKIEKIKEEFNDEVKYFSDYNEMLDSGLVDAVIVTVPHYLHPEIVIKALNKGLHVLCDKPAGVYTKQVKEMNEVAKKSNSIFAMMFNQRTNCLYRKMKEMIEVGEIGNIQRINWVITNWFRNQNYYDSGSWRATWKGEGGGVLINQCPHQLDLVQWIVGEMPIKVNGFLKYGRWHDIEVEDEVTAYFEYKSGATGVFITTTGEAPGTNRLEISGTKGKLVCDNGQLIFIKNKEDSMEHLKNAKDGFSMPECEKIIVETDGLNEQHQGIINNFIDAILKRDKLFVDGKEGINGVELMNAIELSGFKGGESVSIPVDEEEYLKELNKKIKISKNKVGNDNAVIDTNNTFWNVKV